MDRNTAGLREYAALIGGDPATDLASVRVGAPDLFEALVDGAFGGALSRPELSRRSRELATVAMLATQGGAERQLATHARTALRNGVAPSELRALAEHVSVYAGFPRALNALAVIDQVLTDAGVPKPAIQHRIRLADHETVVAQRGETGPAVIMAHSLGVDWRMWEPVMAGLAASGRRVFAYDMRHHGRAAGAPAAASMDDLAADLIGVLDGLGVEEAHVVGLSMGGSIAETAVVNHPERFASMALLATSDHPFPTFEDRARSGETDGLEAQVVPTMTRWFTPGALATDGWGVRYAREQLRRVDPSDWAAAWRVYKTLDVADRLGAVDLPTLVLAGELDASTTPAIMSGIAGRIPGARYQELPGTPHQQTLERPELVIAALDAFLPADGAR